MKSPRFTFICAALLITIALVGSPAGAATAPDLGTSGSFGVLAGSEVTNTGNTTIEGNLGVSAGSAVTGFPPGTVTPPGTIHSADAVAGQAQSDLTTAYNSAAGAQCDFDLTGQDLGGMTLVPGTYCFDTSAQLTGALALNTKGNPASVFIFKIGSTLTTASASSVGFINGPSCNIFWQIGSSATLGTTTQFTGSILAFTSITATTGATVEGRLLARGGAVTMDSNPITKPSCSVPTPTPTPTPTPGPTPTSTPSPTPTVIAPDTALPPGSVVSPADIVFTSVPGATGTTTSAPTSSSNPSPSGQTVTFTTGVISNDSGLGVPTGLVTFLDGSTVLGTAPLDGTGKATFTSSSLTPGSHSITAVYQGGPGFSGSISTALVQVQQPGGPTLITTSTIPGLPRTGINALPLGLTGLTAILLGIGLELEGRRRARKSA